MTVFQAIQQAREQIDRRDAELLLLHHLQRDRAWLLAHPEAELGPGEITAFFEDVTRRAGHWPLQYLTGRQEFFGLPLQVSRDTLIPRPETELLVEAVLAWVGESQQQAMRAGTALRVVDVGTGTGAIALALASRLPEAIVLALDLSPRVRTVVEGNARRLGFADRVTFVESDLLRALQGETGSGNSFDVIISNPPYIPLTDAASLAPQVRDFEPHLALFAGEDGLAVYRRLLPEAWEALRPGGLLALEFGFGQQSALEGMLRRSWSGVRFLSDYAGIPRIALAERPLRGAG